MTHAFLRSQSVTLPVDTNRRQDNPLWLQMWRENRTDDFHQTVVNPLLTRYWHRQKLKKRSRILVPLCGKSLDMLWLAGQGHSVIGIELSPIAVAAFFSENNLRVKKSRNGNFTRWQSGAIVIWCGDFFSLDKQRLGRIDSVFDRAALTALPESVRVQYVTQLRSLIEVETGVFLLSVEDVSKACGQPVNHIDSEISKLYDDHLEIRLTYSERLDAVDGCSEGPCSYIDNKVYQLCNRLSSGGGN